MEMSLRKRISRTAFIYAFIHLMLYGVQRLCIIPVRQMENVNTGVVSILLSTIPLYLIGFPTAVFLFKKLPSFPDEREEKVLNSFQLLNYFIVCYAFMFFGGMISASLENFLSEVMGEPVSDPAALLIMSDVPFWLLFISTVIIAPIGEELLFRYLPYKKLCGFGIFPYMFTSSFCFSLFHMNFFQGIYTFFASLVFSYVYAKTKRLRYPIMLHMMINFIGSVLAPLASKYEGADLYFTCLLLVISFTGITEFIIFTFRKGFQEINEGFYVLKFKWLFNPGSIVFLIIFITASLRAL